ncbi:hypothetical protein S1361_00600 [Streptomyces cyanogenus]|uniref:Uncharacterized protein n=1 Tax=Streptomyces cyanogenus TaxID=80860 RepID=A0ABX7TJT6_STRCY|nr:hypothetical protein S1361_00600 [Streptomyces cyanogenus]
MPVAATRTTGVRPRRPQVRPWAASGPGQPRPRSRPRCPSPPPSFHDGPLLVLPGGDLRLVPLGGLTGWDLHTPADAVQQQVQPGQGVLHAEPAAHDLGDPRQRPALITPAARGRASIQHRLQKAELFRGELAAGATGTLGSQGLPIARSQRPPPAIRRHPGHPEPPGHLPVTGPGFDQVSGSEPDLLTPSPFLGRQSTAIRIPHPPGIARPTPAVTLPRNPHRQRSLAAAHQAPCPSPPAQAHHRAP